MEGILNQVIVGLEPPTLIAGAWHLIQYTFPQTLSDLAPYWNYGFGTTIRNSYGANIVLPILNQTGHLSFLPSVFSLFVVGGSRSDGSTDLARGRSI